MHIFYAPGFEGSSHILSGAESKHCIRVLRMSKGTSVRLMDGEGGLYEGLIDDPDPVNCRITVTRKIPVSENRGYRLQVGISPLKNRERFEWFVEKCVEIGIDVITPVICHRSEKNRIDSGRTERIIISAMKQSVKLFKPVLSEATSFKSFIREHNGGIRMISHCSKSFSREKMDAVYQRGNNAVILIGPEGDFTDEEIAGALENGYVSVHLGSSRLRTETAGLAACHSVYFINQ